jgi:hypothetical protein
MVLKLTDKKSDSNFKGYHLLLIVSNFKDYQLAHFINIVAKLNLKKYDDFLFTTNPEIPRYYSWFHYHDDKYLLKYYLLENQSNHNYLFSNLKKIDFLLFIKGSVSGNAINELEQKLREIRGVTAVLRHEVSVLKDIQIFLDEMELHELEYVTKPLKKISH